MIVAQSVSPVVVNTIVNGNLPNPCSQSAKSLLCDTLPPVRTSQEPNSRYKRATDVPHTWRLHGESFSFVILPGEIDTTKYA